jgi:hypothetical protein
MELIAVVAVIFLIAVQLAWVTKIDLAYLFAPAIFFISGWGFIFGLLGYLNLAMETLVLFVGLILIILLVKGNGFRSKLIKSSYAPSTVAFVSLSLISLYKSKDWVLSQWDEFTHWGLVVKAMHEYSALGPATPVEFMVPKYPPGIPLFQYFVMDFSSGWREGLLFWATHLIVIALIVSVFAKSSYAYLSEIALKLFLALAASSVFFNNFDNIYADPVLALAFGFLLFVAIQASHLDGRWTLVLALTAGFVTLIKPVGIYFATAAILLNVASTLFTVKLRSGKNAGLAFVPALVALTTVGSVWAIWNSYWLSFSSSSAGLITSNVPSALNAGNDVKQISSDFVSGFFSTNLRPGYSVPMSSFYWTLICGVSFIIWALLTGKIVRLRNIAIGVTLIVTTVGYFLLILLSYLTVFGPSEAAGLASYGRYISTWYQGVFFAIVMLILSQFSLDEFFDSASNHDFQKESVSARRKASLFVATFVGVATLSSAHNYMLMLSVSKDQGNEIRAPFIPIKEALTAAKIPEESSVYIIANHTVGFEYYVLRYEMAGLKFGQVPWSIGTPFGDEDFWTDPAWDIDKWSQELRAFDYVVLYSTTESFNNEFGSLFESGIVEPNSVYRIIKTDDTVSLSKVD